MDLYKRTGFILLVIIIAIHFGLIRPAIKKKWKETYYFGKLPFYLSGLYYFYELNAYKKQRVEENQSLWVWFLSIVLMGFFLLWLFPGSIIYLLWR